ncbi:hypothetical protein [Nocardioides sp. TF02-7]|uniref:hypothetical protein n=1 Tax=Nocardioides sp. TF02-7 TaxID=2917724 RepID=UPI001F05535D|nr:hypothetical protein [Nocardioides sp. TF02-7]UMG94006.1 hypothetical protein MF408_07985 [Nocardioides sp. TF02-7]
MGRTVGLVVLAVLVVVGLGIGGYLGVSALVGDDGDADAGRDGSSRTTDAPTEDTTGTDPTEDATDDPTDGTTALEEPTEPSTEQCTGGDPTPTTTPPAGARNVSGGGLTMPVPRGYEPNVDYAMPFTWADDFTPVQKVIEIGDEQQYGWVSIYGVGGLARGNGFDDPAQAAEAVMQCMAASSDLYSSFTGRTDVSAGPVTVDGHEAHQVTAELRVDDPRLEATGDLAQVVVVDTGDPETLGLYITVVPLGDDALAREQARMVDRIRVR